MAKKITENTEPIPAEQIVQKSRGGALVSFAIIALGILVALIIFFNTRPTQLKLVTDNQVSVGQTSTFTLQTGNFKIANGEKYTWYVDGEKMGEGTYSSGKDLTVDVVAQKVGQGKVVVKGKKWTATANYVALNPSVVITLPHVESVYGQPLPKMDYTVDGLPQGKSLDFDGKIVPTTEINGTGVYQLGLDKEYKGQYNVSVKGGTLSVLPKELTIKQGQFTKPYDGCDKMKVDDVCLEGVKEGDQVFLLDNTIYFCDKNAGTSKTLCTDKMSLTGRDAKNYVLSKEQTATGRITKKIINVVDTTVCDKPFDGSKSATINEIGTLKGVCDGDMVAIGGCKAQYRTADVGQNKVVQIDQVSLVGKDKDNYLILPYTTKGNVTEQTNTQPK